MDNLEKALQTYLWLMEMIRFRYIAITEILVGEKYKTPYAATQIEFCVLQIRKILETIALGSLVANSDLYRTHYSNIERMWNGKLILQDMERVNPLFYPKAVVVKDNGEKLPEFVEKTTGALTKEEYIDIYNKCGKLLHADSPFEDEKKIDLAYKEYKRDIPIWCEKIMELLQPHLIYLVDGKTMFYIVMKTKEDDSPSGNIFEAIIES